MGTGDKSGPQACLGLHNFPLVLGKLLVGRGTDRRVPDLPGASLSLLQTKGSPQSTFLSPLKAKAKATVSHTSTQCQEPRTGLGVPISLS